MGQSRLAVISDPPHPRRRSPVLVSGRPFGSSTYILIYVMVPHSFLGIRIQAKISMRIRNRIYEVTNYGEQNPNIKNISIMILKYPLHLESIFAFFG
jgi:hypothetical protein